MKTVIEMAREVGAIHIHQKPKEFAVVGNEALKRFAELVRADAIADEREACANVCEEQEELRGHTPFDCAAAIRARNL